MRYHIIRHAQTKANAKGKLSCDHSEMLDRVGHKQSEKLSQYLLTQQFNDIWVSPIPRALETIQPYLKMSRMDYNIEPLIAEGQYNIDPHAGIEYAPSRSEDLPPINETVENFRGRVQNFINKITSDPQPGSTLIITHGHFIREFLNLLLGATTYARWPIGNCHETLVEVSEDLLIKHVNRNVIQH
jgi:broad specificity phosphatase PhoE